MSFLCVCVIGKLFVFGLKKMYKTGCVAFEFQSNYTGTIVLTER